MPLCTVGAENAGVYTLPSESVTLLIVATIRLRVALILENAPYRGSFDFAERGFDLVLGFSPLRSSAVIEQDIVDIDWALCASPDYLARAGRLQSPSDLADHACLVHVDVAPNDNIWRFEGPKGAAAVKVRGTFLSNAALTLGKAATAGLGITLVPRYAVADDLAAGTLVNVLPRYRVAPRPLLAVYPRAPVIPRKVQAFVDFLKAWMAEHDVGRTRVAAE